MTTSKTSILPRHVVLYTGALALFAAIAGCSAAAPSDGTATARSNEALASSGGGTVGGSAGWGCPVGSDDCSCDGDADCNDMFGSGLCGPIAKCVIDANDVPHCTCTMAITAPPPHKPIHAPIDPLPPILKISK